MAFSSELEAIFDTIKKLKHATWTKLCNFLIRYHTKLPQDGAGMYPSCDTMLIIAMLLFTERVSWYALQKSLPQYW